jgi:hypothetical protein
MRVVGVVADVKQGALNSETEPQTYQPWLQVDDRMLGENVLGIFRGIKVSVRTAVTPLAVTSRFATRFVRSIRLCRSPTSRRCRKSSTHRPDRNGSTRSCWDRLRCSRRCSPRSASAASSRRRSRVANRRLGSGWRSAHSAAMWSAWWCGKAWCWQLPGVAIGLPASIALTRLISSLLFEVTPRDPATFTAVTTLLIGGRGIRLLLAGAPGDAHRTDRGAATGMRGAAFDLTERAIVNVCERGPI